MPFVIGLAVLNMDMSRPKPCRRHTQRSLRHRHGKRGWAVWMWANRQIFLLLDGESPAILAYHAGVSPVEEVYKKGIKSGVQTEPGIK